MGGAKNMNSAHDASTARLVVIIDDDPLALDAIAGLLRCWGYRAVSAASDGAALAQLAQLRQSPDLIISDYHLAEGATGIEAIERIRKAYRVPAILMTGDAAPERLREAHAHGHQVLHKPVNPGPLRTMLTRVLEGTARRGS
jgi:CheY-like chemotaxis protein